MKSLSQNDGPFDSSSSDDEISWMVAALDLGNIFSPLPCCFLVDRWGRKPLLILMGPLSILSWTLIYLGRSMTSVYVARVLQGFQCGISSTVVPLYLSEISEPQIRGAMNTIPSAAVNIGILFCYMAGPYVSYKTLTTLCILLSIPYAVTVYHIPETPYFHLMRKNVGKAKRFLEWARTDFSEDELIKMKENVDSEMELAAQRQPFLERHNLVALLSVLFMYVIPTFTFYWVIPEYATRTFSTTTSTVTPDQFTILLGIFTLLGTLPSTYLIDRLGRRQITLVSAMLTAVFAYLAAVYFFISERRLLDTDDFSWCICILTSGLLCSASLGLGQMYSILQSEYFPSNSRALAGALVAAVGSVFSVVADKMYLSIADSVGMYFNFFISGSMSLLVFIFAWFFMIETKGKTFAEIQVLFRDKLSGGKKVNSLADGD